MLVGRSVAHAPGIVSGLVWACWRGRDHGLLDSFWGSGEWCEYAFGFPDRHPRRLVACGFPDVPLGRSAGRCAVSGSFLGCVVV